MRNVGGLSVARISVACNGVMLVKQLPRESPLFAPSDLRRRPFRVIVQSQLSSDGTRRRQRVVLAHRQAELGSRCEQSIGLIDSAGDEIIDKHADVRCLAAEYEWVAIEC